MKLLDGMNECTAGGGAIRGEKKQQYSTPKSLYNWNKYLCGQHLYHRESGAKVAGGREDQGGSATETNANEEILLMMSEVADVGEWMK